MKWAFEIRETRDLLTAESEDDMGDLIIFVNPDAPDVIPQAFAELAYVSEAQYWLDSYEMIGLVLDWVAKQRPTRVATKEGELVMMAQHLAVIRNGVACHPSVTRSDRPSLSVGLSIGDTVPGLGTIRDIDDDNHVVFADGTKEPVDIVIHKATQ